MQPPQGVSFTLILPFSGSDKPIVTSIASGNGSSHTWSHNIITTSSQYPLPSSQSLNATCLAHLIHLRHLLRILLSPTAFPHRTTMPPLLHESSQSHSLRCTAVGPIAHKEPTQLLLHKSLLALLISNHFLQHLQHFPKFPRISP